MAKARAHSATHEPRLVADFLGFSHFDPSTLSHVVAGAEFEHRRLPGGEPDINLLQCTLPHSVISRGDYAPAVLVNGTFARNSITLGTMLRQQQPTLINGTEVRTGTLQVYAEGTEMCYRAWPQGTWFAFVVTRERLERFCREYLEVDMDLPTSGITHFKPETRAIGERFLTDMRDLDQSLRVLGASEHAARIAESVEHDLLVRMTRMLRPDWRVPMREERTHALQCRGMMQDAIALVANNQGEMLDLRAIARATGMSPRTLQRNFQRTCGLCPQEWCRIERLNRVRNDLLNARNGDSVTQTAMRWGFFHLGRFAQYYRELFGETPIQTLRSSSARR